MNSKAALAITLITLLSGCLSTADSESEHSSSIVETFYDYQLLSPNQQKIDVTHFTQQIKDADVVLVGEWHTHAGIHRFQSDLLRSMHQIHPDVALSMEQFSRDKQSVVNQYLSNDIGEQTLISEANAWPNYESDYRPLVEFAKQNNLNIIASNAPKSIVRCIGREGIDYLNKLPETQRAWLATSISLADSPYQRHFLASMHHGTETQNLNQYAAQVTWDDTMAESIVSYLTAHPNSQVMHIAGKFHIENGLGTAASILARAPHLNVVVVSPISPDQTVESGNTDYRLQVMSPPTRFIKRENMMASFKQLAERNSELQCIP
ncbi:ChaN family lipoprotein [Aliivibrio kagoshimensis]|uniref:ChaN family lipoprotein n=1 Tax=Aliivibrio kagoshimensis TaxID=2910230 RepID=UPI003D14D0B9